MMKSKKEEKKPNKHSEKKFKVTVRFSDDPEEEKMKRLFKVFDILLSKQGPSEHTDLRKKGEN